MTQFWGLDEGENDWIALLLLQGVQAQIEDRSVWKCGCKNTNITPFDVYKNFLLFNAKTYENWRNKSITENEASSEEHQKILPRFQFIPFFNVQQKGDLKLI